MDLKWWDSEDLQAPKSGNKEHNILSEFCNNFVSDVFKCPNHT